jgi:hypothetical protein
VPSRQAVGGIAIPEADQQITAQPHAFPTEQQKQQIIPQQQRDHRRDEQVHIGEETAVPLVCDHELGRINVNQEGNESHH